MYGSAVGFLLAPRRRRRWALIGVALAVVSLLVAFMFFVPAVRDSDSASSAVAVLLGAATATIVQLFIAPAMARQARRDERAEQAMIDMRLALIEELGPVIADVRKVTAPIAALEAEVQRHPSPAAAKAAVALLDEQRQGLTQIRDRVLRANEAVWIHFAFAADRELKRLYDETSDNLSEILGLERPCHEPVSGAKLDGLAKRSRQNVDLMVKHLTLRLTGAADSPLGH